MKLKSLMTSGWLDVSAQETLQEEREPFRVVLAPGQVIEVDDRWLRLNNIRSAITAGLLQVLEYSSSETDVYAKSLVLADNSNPKHYWQFKVTPVGTLNGDDAGENPPDPA